MPRIKEPKPVDPNDYQRIADSIAQLSNTAKALNASNLSRTAVLVLLNHATKIPQRDIAAVLNAAEELQAWCLKK